MTGLRLHTSAGLITIDFSGAPAPIAQANLAGLASGGYFDGLTFHRVVPGFVIQGGDPRGDGYGGPGHVVPCEWSTVRYERGMVGIALAGKDTGGSQLFIVHDRPPRLDGRYPIIGRVVEGMEVVDQIWPYDQIERVELVTAETP
ncbi:MAG: peptidylprolyl isomerase [Deltaproteobacteria bacterium]|nr:peptidylprolyl isomerase [Deltaproteobacteria bacterium]